MAKKPKPKGDRIIQHVGHNYIEKVEGNYYSGDSFQGVPPHDMAQRATKEDLQTHYQLLSEKISELRKAYILETDPATKFKLKKQIAEAEADLITLEQQLEA